MLFDRFGSVLIFLVCQMCFYWNLDGMSDNPYVASLEHQENLITYAENELRNYDTTLAITIIRNGQNSVNVSTLF